MTSIFVANASTLGEFEAEQDDRTITSLADFAAPQVMSVTLKADQSWITGLRLSVEEDLRYELEDGVELRWTEAEEMTYPKGPNVKRVWVHTCHCGGDEVAKLVIQERVAE